MSKVAAPLLPIDLKIGDQIKGNPIIDDGSDAPVTIVGVFTGKSDYKTIIVVEQFGFLHAAHLLSKVPLPIGKSGQISYWRDGNQIYPEVSA